MPPVDPATAGASPADRAAIVAAFVDAAGGLETAGYCRTDHWSGAFANSAGHVVEGTNADIAVAGIARRDGCDGVARATSRRLADIDGGGARRPRRGEGQRRASTRSSCRPAATRSCSSRPPSPTSSSGCATLAFNAKAVAERRSFVRLGDAQFDPAIRLVDDAPAAGWPYDADGTPHASWCSSTAGRRSP